MKPNSFLFALTASSLVLFASCGGDDGGWPQEEQDAFIENCVPNAAQNTEIDADAYCNCMLGKMMKEYPKPEDVEDMDLGQMMEMAKDCQ